MLEILLQPFSYEFMARAILVSALIGAVCAFLSSYLIMKGWSLMGDAMSHSVVPGAALGYMLDFSYVVGAFCTGILAALGMFLVKQKTKLKEDVTIGIVFTTFFAVGLFLISLNPTSVSLESITLGNILSISNEDLSRVVWITLLSFALLMLKWKDLMLVFFDEPQARAVGIVPWKMKMMFFMILSACVVAALQTVGAILVVAMVITPGATAFLLTKKFSVLIILATSMGCLTSAVGAYLSYFFDGATGGFIVCLQTLIFAAAFLFSPQQGVYGRYRLRKQNKMHELKEGAEI